MGALAFASRSGEAATAPVDYLNQMAIFVKVIDENGFSRAAKALGLTKSTISKQVAALEERLGVHLLERSSRKLATTDTGRAFYQRAVQVIADADAAMRAVAEINDAPRGTLRVFAPSTFGRVFLSPVFADFLEKYPAVEVELIYADRPVDMIGERFDVAIQLAPPSESTLIVRRIGELRRHLCASPAYLAARGEPATPDDLLRHDGLLYSETAAPEVWRLERDGAEVAIKMRGRARANSIEALTDLMLCGRGIGYPPTFATAARIKAGALRTVLPEWSSRSVPIFVVCPPGRTRDPKVRAFVDLVVERLGATAWAPREFGG
jgi:DNA-binding transcriptional LysR family regulator